MKELLKLFWKDFKIPICVIGVIVGSFYIAKLSDATMKFGEREGLSNWTDGGGIVSISSGTLLVSVSFLAQTAAIE